MGTCVRKVSVIRLRCHVTSCDLILQQIVNQHVRMVVGVPRLGYVTVDPPIMGDAVKREVRTPCGV